MTRRAPTILADFDREIARAPKWCNVDRGLLQRVVVAVVGVAIWVVVR